MRHLRHSLMTALSILIICSDYTTAQNFEKDVAAAFRWRMIGPFRGGRTVGAVGVRQQPNVFYIGVNNGGVWKTEDFGRTWFPIFDDQPTGSIGDIVVAPSDPNILYVGSGEGLQRPDLSVGDGVYKSTDAGKTWKHTGLRDGQQIGGLAIDPENPDRVFAAVLGHPYGANTERGVFRTINGGSSWEKVLFIDENTGAIQVTLDPKDTKTVYATLWAARQGPWENGSWQGPASGLYKSTDGGTTWKKLTQGLPTTKEGLGRIGFCIAPSLSSRLYATVDSPEKGGLYRSDDGGNSWRLMNPDNRLWGRGGDFAEVKVDPRNPDIVYSANVAFWKSTDGGKNWTCVRGAPGGDDYHRIWINPDNPDIMLLAADQGAIITVNGGKTYSSWYNQPTAQFYHVSTDNAFPYNVLGGQQESGSASVSSRGHGGQITYRDWLPVGVEEWGYVAADPLNPDLVYGGKLTKYDRKTGHTQSVGPFPTGHYQPNRSPYRFLRTAPVIFSQADPTALYYAGNVLFKSQDGGHAWRIISPDLSRESWDVPKSIGVYTTESMKTMARRGVIYTVAPSPLDSSVIWAGTDDGLIHITRDGGKTWQNVTPAEITSWSKISLIDAGHFDVNTAYVAVNRIRLDDMKPYIYKTHDGGKTWIKIVEGLPDDPINAVREDHIKEGLLICGSERAVYASVNDGQNWLSLRNNMPATSIRDIVIKDNDIVAGTHGRSFWIMDDIMPLRHITEVSRQAPVWLFKPSNAYRVRWNLYTDTPLPQEEPAGENPPDGAIIYYHLKQDAQTPIVIEIKNSRGEVVRRFSSNDSIPMSQDNNFPSYWLAPPQRVSAKAGSHRLIWDLRHNPLPTEPEFSIAAIYGKTTPAPTSPLVMPGFYSVVISVNGLTMGEGLTLVMDPRVRMTDTEIKDQFDLSMRCYEIRKKGMLVTQHIQSWRVQADIYMGQIKSNSSEIKKFLGYLDAIEKGNTATGDKGLQTILQSATNMFDVIQHADMPPTAAMYNTVRETEKSWEKLTAEWEKLKTVYLNDLNAHLKKNKLPEISNP